MNDGGGKENDNDTLMYSNGRRSATTNSILEKKQREIDP